MTMNQEEYWREIYDREQHEIRMEELRLEEQQMEWQQMESEIARLRDENARLRSALEAIERNCPKYEPKRVQLTARRSGKTTEWILWTNGNIARAALENSEADNG